MPRLVINPGTAHQWERALKAGPNTLGRSAACDIQIDHESVSGTHCEITVAGPNVTVRDLGSTNGSFLDRAPIQEVALLPGQRLQLGGVEVELVADAPPPPPSPPVPPERAIVRHATVGSSPARVPAPAVADVVSAPAPPGPPPPIPPRTGLRVTVHEAPPPPPSVPAVYVPDEYAVEAQPAMCKYHPRTHARFLCPQCQFHYCELCVTTRPGGTRTGRFCRKCSGECVAMNVQIVSTHPHENFFASVPAAFLYPFQGLAGIMFLFGGAVAFAILEALLVFRIGAGVLFTSRLSLLGYLFAYLQKIIHVAALGEDDPPSWPDVSDFLQDLILPGLQFLGALAVSFGPALALLFWAGLDLLSGASPDPFKELLVVGATAFGVLYFPMAVLAVAMYDNAAALNPLLVLPSMFKVPLEYLLVLLVMAAAIGVWALGHWLMSLLPLPVLTAILSKWLTLYLLTVGMRLLGLMYYAKRQKLGWLQA